jgi:hypothetical protein
MILRSECAQLHRTFRRHRSAFSPSAVSALRFLHERLSARIVPEVSAILLSCGLRRQAPGHASLAPAHAGHRNQSTEEFKWRRKVIRSSRRTVYLPALLPMSTTGTGGMHEARQRGAALAELHL